MIKRFSIFIKIFAILGVLYWLVLYLLKPQNELYYNIFGFLLLLLPLFGVSLGFLISKGWSGFSSYVGKSITFISLSLLMWVIGEGLFLYYSIATGEVPYPGLPDYFFVLIDPFYALGTLSIMWYSGAKSSLKSVSWRHLLLLIVPLLSAFANYKIFFVDSSYFETIDPEVIWDLIYSFGSITIMSLIVLTAVLSIKKLGGKMRNAIYFIFAGVAIQYLGDIAFSFAELDDAAYNGNLADFIFFLSITLVVIGIANLNTEKLNGGGETKENAIS